MGSSSESPFHTLVSAIDYPMFVVTAAARGQRSGCVVGFLTQCSIDPPRLMVMISKANHTYGVAVDATHLGVHFLTQRDGELAELFGEETGDRTDKFDQCAWEPAADGTPLLRGTAGWVLGTVRERMDCGDHVAHLLDVADAHLDRLGPQLSFRDVAGMKPGHPA